MSLRLVDDRKGPRLGLTRVVLARVPVVALAVVGPLALDWSEVEDVAADEVDYDTKPEDWLA